MATYAIATATEDTHVEEYRRAERALWDHYDLRPSERFVDVDSVGARLRVLEAGEGIPVLFVHGTVGPGSWVSLVRQLPGLRSIVLDRPGWALSTPIDFSRREYGPLTADLLRGVLDGLGLDRAHLVGGSIGNVWALRLALRYPDRVGRVVLTGGGPIVDRAGVPGVIRVLASPAGALMVRLSRKPKMVRTMLRKSGHGASLDAGRIPDAFIDWRAALGRETESMRHEREMVQAVVSGRDYRPGVTFTGTELAAIAAPMLHIFGTEDPVGTAVLWSEVARLLPHGELRVVDGAGHMPWFDDVEGVGRIVRRFLTAD